MFLTIFVGSNHAVKFYCYFGMSETSNPVVGSVYRCDAVVSYYRSETTALEGVDGYHSPPKTNFYVEHLSVVRENLTFVPQNIDYFMPNIRSILWKNGNLMNISARDLEQFPQLEALTVSYQKLVSIDGNLFVDVPYVSWISFEGNAIRNVGYDLVTDLYELQYLSFRRNRCVNREASTPEEILILGMQLPSLCPPLGSELTTISTSTVPLIVSPLTYLDHIIEAVEQEILFSEKGWQRLKRRFE